MRLLPALIALSALLPSLCLAADGIFTYTEPDGTIVYTNVAPPSGTRSRKLAGTFKAAPKATEVPDARARATTDFDDHIDQAAKRYKIPAALVRAIMHTESNFDSTALSPKGASGLMQLMPETAQNMYVKDIFAPRDNIEGGVRYLRVLANMYDGDMVKMIAAYNAGPEAVRRYNGVPPYEETRLYCKKVLAYYRQLKAQSAQRKLASREEPTK